ncbi:MAG: hypothetical protein N2376_03790 [Clostridia bacterium]|nr:hypothetical protein [Clostridia bacterium]
MAAIGLQYSVYSPLTENDEDGTHTYGIGKRGRKMIKADVKIKVDEGKLFCEDGVGEAAKEFTDGTITINQDELTVTMRKDLLGNTTKSITVGSDTIEELSSKDTDIQPFVGFGFIQTKKIDNVRQYRAVFFPKVQFGEPDESAETKGEKISWQTPTIVGTIMRRNDGVWKEETTTPSLSTAIAYIKSKANIT